MSEHNIYVEPEDETVEVDLQDEVVVPGGGGGAGVSSFKGRTGAVQPQSGDYTKAMVGLDKVDNTADADKPVSTPQQTALNLKANNTQTFTEAETRENIASGETVPTLFGKIKKFFADLKAVAFSGSYNDLSDKPSPYSLPIASGSTLGGIKVGSGLSIASGGVLSATGGGGEDKLSILTKNCEKATFYDDVTDTYYSVIKIYKKKVDGTNQRAFVFAPTGKNGNNYSPLSAMETFANSDGLAVLINGGVCYTTSPYNSDGVLIQNGRIIVNDSAEYYTGAIPLVIDTNGDLTYANTEATAEEIIANGGRDAVLGFCPIIINYENATLPAVAHVSHFNQAAQRQIIGQYPNGDYCIITSEGRNFYNSTGWKLSDAQRICKSLNLIYAYNLDGGGSTGTVIGLKQLNKIYENEKGRKLPTYIVFTNNDTFTPSTEGSTTYWDGVTYAARYNLTHCTISNTTKNITKNASYTATLTADSGYTLSSVTVIMHGVDVTASVYNNGVINIPSITGNIKITATASVGQKTLTSISATKTVTTYSVGDTLSTADIAVTATYSDTTTADVTASAVFDTSNVNMNTAGTYSIGVSYTEGGVTETTSVSITVSAAAKVLQSITATKTTTAYNVGDTLTTNDITVTAHYSDSTTADVTASATINTASVDMNTAGTYSIGVSYTEDGITETTSISITVSDSSQYTILQSKTLTGNKYVQTNISETELYNYEAKVNIAQSTGASQSGSGHLLSSTNTYYPFLRRLSNTNQTPLFKIKGTEDSSNLPNWSWDTDYVLTGTINGGNYHVTCSDILTQGRTVAIGSTVSAENKFALFTYGGDTTATKYRFRGIFYYMILKDTNNVEVHHFVPAIRNADSVEGILDTVTNTFYTYA